MISKISVKEFERHHAFILVFMIVASMFAANVYALDAAYDNVTSSVVNSLDRGDGLFHNLQTRDVLPHNVD